MTDTTSRPDLDARWNDVDGMTEAMRRGVREALLRHKKLGESIAIWRDGRVVIVSPEEIVADDERTGHTSGGRDAG
jgi:hypothetical protein